MIIGVSGKKQSGKDTVGKIIQYLYWKQMLIKKDPVLEGMMVSFNEFSGFGLNDQNFKIVKFADKLKEIVCILTGCTKEQLENEEFKNSPLPNEWLSHYDECYYGNIMRECYTYRETLQLIGTDLFRNRFHNNTWVNATMVDYNSKSKWVITDVRFPNEVAAIKEKNGLLIRVNRESEIDRWKKIDTDGIHEYPVEHISETALDSYKEWNYVISNNGTIDDLIIKVETILQKEGVI